MSRIEELADLYARHIATPWQTTVSGAQRVIIATYDKESERMLRARVGEFENRTREAGHDWHLLDITGAFATWMASDEYREAYFESPEDLQLKLDAEFPHYVAEIIRKALCRSDVTQNSVVALLGAASLFGFARVSQILKLVERDIRGRLLVLFPGQAEQNNYRLLDSRDGWNYMAIPISMHSSGSPA